MHAHRRCGGHGIAALDRLRDTPVPGQRLGGAARRDSEARRVSPTGSATCRMRSASSALAAAAPRRHGGTEALIGLRGVTAGLDIGLHRRQGAGDPLEVGGRSPRGDRPGNLQLQCLPDLHDQGQHPIGPDELRRQDGVLGPQVNPATVTGFDEPDGPQRDERLPDRGTAHLKSLGDVPIRGKPVPRAKLLLRDDVRMRAATSSYSGVLRIGTNSGAATARSYASSLTVVQGNWDIWLDQLTRAPGRVRRSQRTRRSTVDIENTFNVPAAPREVFDLLSDVEQVAPCMPGATIIGREGDDYQGRFRIKVGPVAAAYEGGIAVVSRDEEQGRIVLRGRGTDPRGAGSAEATIAAEITRLDDGSRVAMATSLQVGGRLAQFTGRSSMMQSVADRVIGQFADRLTERLTNGAANVGSEAPPRPEGGRPIVGSKPTVGSTRAAAAGTPHPREDDPAGADDAGEDAFDAGSIVADMVQDHLEPVAVVAVLVALAVGFAAGLRRGSRRRLRFELRF